MTDAGARRSGRFALWGRTGLGVRVFIGLAVVVAVEGCVVGVVAWLSGPTQFARHLAMAGIDGPEAVAHAQEAYLASIGVALGVALLVAVLAGIAAAWFIARQLSTPLQRFAATAQAVSAGEYAVRVDQSGLGPEFDAVESAFNDMTARLEASESARTQLIADLSHEMRTPLMTLTAYIEALEDGVRPPLATTWEVMSDQVRRLSRLTSDMAIASADTEGALAVEKAECDLTALVTLVVRTWRTSQPSAGIEIVGHVPSHPAYVRCDASRVEQVLANLIDNACRHARGVTRIDVTAWMAGDWAHISVEDDGAGVAPGDWNRIFDRFYRADRSRTGTGAGLGLAISRSIMQAHGGRLQLEDGTLGGARFVATLPVW